MGEAHTQPDAAAPAAVPATAPATAGAGDPPDGVPVPPHAPRRRPVRNRRVVLTDQRGAERHLRVTWHRDTNTFVISTWADQVCAGSVRVPVDQAPELIGLLADGLGEAVGYAAPPEPGDRARGRSRSVVDTVLGWLGLRRAAGATRSRRRAAPAAAQEAQILKLR